MRGDSPKVSKVHCSRSIMNLPMTIFSEVVFCYILLSLCASFSNYKIVKYILHEGYSSSVQS